ncbi:acetyltransferase [Cladophialophora carrionii]|uniref:Acetyltransferase n=1 Tax=Cladophialophora carrionii TaxID=86049 RepID=A0A1C1CVR3_9EURO|nr:acetyltransferase [Cladophialophora carrionii]
MLVQQHPLPLPAPVPAPDLAYDSQSSPPSSVQTRLSVASSRTSLPDDLKLTSPSFTVRPATVRDAPAIAHLGATVFSATFGFSIPPHDLTAFLEEAYAAEAIEEDIRCATKHVFVACTGAKSNDSRQASANSSDVEAGDEDDDSRVIGFAQLTEGTTEPCLSHLRSSVELQRLYVSTAHHGRGVGKALAREIELLAQSLGYRSLWLGVWEGNFKAQRVYEGLGFTKVGDHEFKMGKCIQMDWIMCKGL